MAQTTPDSGQARIGGEGGTAPSALSQPQDGDALGISQFLVSSSEETKVTAPTQSDSGGILNQIERADQALTVEFVINGKNYGLTKQEVIEFRGVPASDSSQGKFGLLLNFERDWGLKIRRIKWTEKEGWIVYTADHRELEKSRHKYVNQWGDMHAGEPAGIGSALISDLIRRMEVGGCMPSISDQRNLAHVQDKKRLNMNEDDGTNKKGGSAGSREEYRREK